MRGHAPVVALLLATPGVDPLARNRVRDALMAARDPPACPTPLRVPSAAAWREHAGLCAEHRKCRHSRAAAGGPARCSVARKSRQALLSCSGRSLGSLVGTSVSSDASRPPSEGPAVAGTCGWPHRLHGRRLARRLLQHLRWTMTGRTRKPHQPPARTCPGPGRPTRALPVNDAAPPPVGLRLVPPGTLRLPPWP